MTTMVCCICNKLFSAENMTSLQLHYDRNHRDRALPKSVNHFVDNHKINQKDFVDALLDIYVPMSTEKETRRSVQIATIKQNAFENGTTPNDDEFGPLIYDDSATDSLDVPRNDGKRTLSDANCDGIDDNHNEIGTNDQNQQQQRKHQSLNSTAPAPSQSPPSSSLSSASNFIGEASNMFDSVDRSMSKTAEAPMAIDDFESASNKEMPVHFDYDKPLDLSIPKLSKPFYVFDSDEEAETITIDSDDDDDNKEHLRRIMTNYILKK